MRSRTYAYNGIILGILFGMAAGAYTESNPNWRDRCDPWKRSLFPGHSFS